MATALVTHQDYLKHETGALHPEQPRRLEAIGKAIAGDERLSAMPILAPRLATETEIERVHGHGYLEDVRYIAARGGGFLDVDTPLCGDSYRIAMLSAGGSLAAVEAVLAGQYQHVFVAARPPGHHARPNRGMGFCLFNNVAVAARHALQLGLERVFILDWDVHHGNGTQEAFYNDPSVFFCSLHQSNWYPFTGDADEIGNGPGEGTTLNLPLRAGRRASEYLALVDDIVAPAIRAFQPELLLVSAGQDIHERDPLGEMRLTSQSFREMALRMVDLAAEVCGNRLVVTLEGGYDLTALGESVAEILHGLLGDQPAA